LLFLFKEIETIGDKWIISYNFKLDYTYLASGNSWRNLREKHPPLVPIHQAAGWLLEQFSLVWRKGMYFLSRMELWFHIHPARNTASTYRAVSYPYW